MRLAIAALLMLAGPALAQTDPVTGKPLWTKCETDSAGRIGIVIDPIWKDNAEMVTKAVKSCRAMLIFQAEMEKSGNEASTLFGVTVAPQGD